MKAPCHHENDWGALHEWQKNADAILAFRLLTLSHPTTIAQA